MKKFVLKHVKRTLGRDRYEGLKHWFWLSLVRDQGYSAAYYDRIERHNAWCYPLFAAALYERFQPRTVIDLGCGTGGIAHELEKLGCTVHAFDYSRAAVQAARRRGLRDVRRLDLTTIDGLPARADLLISLEVAEHLPAQHAPRFCRLISRAADVLAVTAAPPGQTGHLHLNERPPEYWIELLAREGAAFHRDHVAALRERWRERMISDYDQNLMVFVAASASARDRSALVGKAPALAR